MPATKATERLQELGLSEYESRAYISLLSRSPITAYETAKLSGIPTSKIYEVLGKLEARGMVLQLDEAGKNLYVAQAASEFLSAQKSRFEATLGELGPELEALGSRTEASWLWPLHDRSALIDEARSMIALAKREVLLSACGEEVIELLSTIQMAIAGNPDLKVAIVNFGPVDASLDSASGLSIYAHPIADTLQNEKGGRGVSLVIDAAHALTGTILASGGVEGVHSRNRGFVLLAEDYIKHDIYIMKIVRRYDAELLARFGVKYGLLRDIFSDREVQ